MYLFLTFFAHSAEYQTLHSLEHMSEISSRIVEGEISAVEGYVKDGKIYSKVTLDVNKTYTGVEESQLEIHVLGGSYNGLNMEVSGLPLLTPNTSALLFLDHDEILGFGQGIFKVTPNQISRFPNTGLPTQNFSANMLPNERDAQSCLAPIIDSHYSDGWHLKHLYTHHTQSDLNNIFPFSAYEGLEYKIISCTDGKPEYSVLKIKDSSGKVLKEISSDAKEQQLEFISDESTYYSINLGVGPSQKETISSGIAVGILYRE